MDYISKFKVPTKRHLLLAETDPGFTGKHIKKEHALVKIQELQKEMDVLQFKLNAEKKQSLLICLQALDAGGKDGVVRHVISGMNMQGCRVVSFKEPTKEELSHDFLWRIEQQTPKPGEVVVFNRSQYEDVLIVRVHTIVPQTVWSKRYAQINAFEKQLAANGTRILKIFLHISKEEQLKRFKQRLDDPNRQWKISMADYSEREYWDDYQTAYEDIFYKCNSDGAPWFIIPSDHKWFRDLAISNIIVDTLKNMNIQVPKPSVDIEEIKKKYHAAAEKEKTTKE